jgi:hypothetical protein
MSKQPFLTQSFALFYAKAKGNDEIVKSCSYFLITLRVKLHVVADGFAPRYLIR